MNACIFIYFFLTLFSGIGTAYYPVSFLKAVYYGLTGILIYFIIYSWKLNQINKISILQNIVMIGFIVSVYGIVTLALGKDVLFAGLEYSKSSVINPGKFLAMGRISSSFGNPHFLGGFLSVIFPASLYLYSIKPEEKSATGYFAAIAPIVIFIAAALTFSVGAFLSIILSLLTVKAYCKKLSSRRISRALFFSGVILLCAILAMMIANILLSLCNRGCFFGKFIGRIDFYKLTNIEGFTYRLDSIKYALGLLKPNLWFGIGVGNISLGNNLFLRTTMDNFYCLSLIESGLIAFSAMLIMFYLIIKKAYAKLKNSVSTEDKSFYFCLSLSIAAFFINMFFWDVFNHPTLRILFWSFAGFLI